jgi:hypothetical protein
MRSYRPCYSLRIVLLAMLAAQPATGPAAAQTNNGLRDSAHLYRQLRAVEGRSLSQPREAARDARDAQQDILRSGHGVALDPSARRVERSLQGLQTPPGIGRAPMGPQTAPSDRLPSSLDDDLLPQRSPTSLARSLLDRAADGLAGGRSDQARSDLVTAEQQLEVLPASGVDAAETAALRQRAADLRRQLP